MQGVGVGGGSLHYFNVNLRAPARVLDRWPAPLGRAQLDPYYALVEGHLESRPLTAPALRVLPPRTEAFVAAARASGAEPRLAPIAVYTGPDRVNRAGVPQSACVYCGNCMLGCHVHAKTRSTSPTSPRLSGSTAPRSTRCTRSTACAPRPTAAAITSTSGCSPPIALRP